MFNIFKYSGTAVISAAMSGMICLFMGLYYYLEIPDEPYYQHWMWIVFGAFFLFFMWLWYPKKPRRKNKRKGCKKNATPKKRADILAEAHKQNN